LGSLIHGFSEFPSTLADALVGLGGRRKPTAKDSKYYICFAVGFKPKTRKSASIMSVLPSVLTDGTGISTVFPGL
jgi:hypothetical protein